MCAHSGFGNWGRTPMHPTVLKDGYSPWWFWRPLSLALRPSSSPLMVDEARRAPAPFLQI